MIADIVHVSRGRARTFILVKDRADGVTRGCYIRLREDIDAWRASLCQRALEKGLGPVVLTVNPPDVFGMEIVDAELLNGTEVA